MLFPCQSLESWPLVSLLKEVLIDTQDFLGVAARLQPEDGNRKVLPILGNCSAYIPLADLRQRITIRNTTVYYLLHNMTSKLQPCN